VVGLDARRPDSLPGLRSVLGRPTDGDEGEPRDVTDPDRFSGATVPDTCPELFFPPPPPPLPPPVLLVAALLLVCSVAF